MCTGSNLFLLTFHLFQLKADVQSNFMAQRLCSQMIKRLLAMVPAETWCFIRYSSDFQIYLCVCVCVCVCTGWSYRISILIKGLSDRWLVWLHAQPHRHIFMDANDADEKAIYLGPSDLSLYLFVCISTMPDYRRWTSHKRITIFAGWRNILLKNP